MMRVRFFRLLAELLFALVIILLPTTSKAVPSEGSSSASLHERLFKTIFSRPQVRFVLFGEMHGTREEPQIFGDAVEFALDSGHPVVVCLEQERGTIDRYIKSDGGAAAKERLIGSEDWKSHDGRSSSAMFTLIERLRLLSREKPNLVVVSVISKRDPNPLSQTPYEKLMAENVAAANKDNRSLALVLVGNIHAMRALSPKFPGSMPFEPMGMHLPADEALSVLFTTDGGKAWNCQDTCAVHDLAPDHILATAPIPQVTQGRYDMIFPVGPVSESSPAR